MLNAVITPAIKSATAAEAFRIGADDAAEGFPFAPESYFGSRVYQIDYARGFESVRGASKITRQFTGSSVNR